MFKKTVDADEAELEVELHLIAERHGFAPKLHKVTKHRTTWSLYMEDLGEESSIAHIYGEDPEDIPESVWDKIRHMVRTLLEEEGIEYVDITPYNFLEKDGRLYMIDYGDARYLLENGQIDWFLQEFLEDHVNNWNSDFR